MLANQYIVTPRSLREVLWDAQIHAGEKITTEDIRDAVNRQISSQLGKSVTQIRSVYSWDDLVIGDAQRNQLKMICSQVRCRTVVGEEWGFYKKAAYGRGICALFYGASGTGKTMAVQVIANELGLGLYRVNLSQIMSKYIGETQKNISDLFQRAENTNAVLFFDEADALFAKRTEVKDSHDRGANAETAYLLQRLEDYDGITILTTNYVNNIDDAFKRRIKFMVPFAFPTPKVRLELWNTLLPQEALLGEELDFNFFAERFELSGSSIKEILTNAAFLAAAEGRGMYNRDLEEAIRLDFAKYGKILTEEDFAHKKTWAGKELFSERETEQSKEMLTANSFGRFRVTAGMDGREFEWRTRKGRELFAYLLDIGGKPVERRTLLDILWREEMPGSSVAMLHNMIYNIRKELSVYQLETILVYENKQYRLDMERISCDITRIEELAQSVRQRKISELRENADSFLEYWGSYLEDIDSPWAEARRQYYDEIYIQGCFLLAEQFMEEEAEEQAVLLYQNILKLSPYSEEAMKGLLLVYGQQKRWEKVRKSYQSFEDVLKRDLGIAPGKEVTEAYRHFLK